MNMERIYVAIVVAGLLCGLFAEQLISLAGKSDHTCKEAIFHYS